STRRWVVPSASFSRKRTGWGPEEAGPDGGGAGGAGGGVVSGGGGGPGCSGSGADGVSAAALLIPPPPPQAASAGRAEHASTASKAERLRFLKAHSCAPKVRPRSWIALPRPDRDRERWPRRAQSRCRRNATNSGQESPGQVHKSRSFDYIEETASHPGAVD